MKLGRTSLIAGILFMFAAALCVPGKAYTSAEEDIDLCDRQYELQSLGCMNDPYPASCNATAADTHYMCMGSIPASPDFCSAARARAYNCQFQFDPLTDFINYSECTTMSGVQFCE
jgi:hypothetical protein